MSAVPPKWNLDRWKAKDLSDVRQAMLLPNPLPLPRYSIGDRCRWIPMSTTDWGTVVGTVVLPEVRPDGPVVWSWVYLILLDPNSPSRQWVAADWAEASELERLPTANAGFAHE